MIEFKRISPALVSNPEAGGDVLFLDAAGVYYTKDENGNLKVLGNGIIGIAKVGTVGLVDTYEVSFDSGDTFQYTVTNAKSIVELVKLGTSVLDSTYRITFNDGPAFEYVVKDGRGIANIEAPANAGQPDTTDTYTVRYNDGTTSTFIVRNGRDGLDGLVLSVNGKSEPNIVLNAADVGAIAAAEKGAPNGVATLGSDSKIPAAQLPSFVDDVLEFANLAAFPATGETGKIYVAIDTGFTYRWSGSQYIEISAAPVTQVNGKVGNVTLTTSDIAEGTNLYFTAARVRDTILTGLSLATNAAITAADTVLSAFGKLQKQLSDHFAAVDPHPQYTTDAEATTIANDAITAHVGQADPHTQYTTTAEAAAAAPVQSFNGRTGSITPQQADYDAFFTTPAEAAAAAPVQSVNGQTGNVVVASGANAITNTARSASFSTAVTTVGTFPITGGSIAAGAQYRIKAVLLVTNTTATSNLVATVAVGATAVATLTQALGATARTAQTAIVEGSITFSSAVAADGHVRGFTSSAVAFDSLAGTGAAAAAVVTATNTDVNLKLNTSAATSTLIVKELTIEKVK